MTERLARSLEPQLTFPGASPIVCCMANVLFVRLLLVGLMVEYLLGLGNRRTTDAGERLV